MQQPTVTAVPDWETDDFPEPPNADELPDSDGMPLDNERQYLQINLCVAPLKRHWRDRADVYIGANMFVYFSADRRFNADFRGPDVFVARNVSAGERRKWVVWIENKAPDVVIEVLSESTAAEDRTTKKQVYQDLLRVPEYFWHDPFTGELAGWYLRNGHYEPIVPDAAGRLRSEQLGLLLAPWHGVYEGVDAPWLRWATLDGALLPTPQEAEAAEHERAERAQQQAEQERQRAEQERQRAEQERQRAEQAERTAAQERQRTVDLEAMLERYRRQFGDSPTGGGA